MNERGKLAVQITAAAEAACTAEGALAAVENERRERALLLKAREAELLALGESGPIQGKNESVRQGQLFQATAGDRVLLAEAEAAVILAAAERAQARLRHRSLLAIAALFSGADSGLEIAYSEED